DPIEEMQRTPARLHVVLAQDLEPIDRGLVLQDVRVVQRPEPEPDPKVGQVEAIHVADLNPCSRLDPCSRSVPCTSACRFCSRPDPCNRSVPCTSALRPRPPAWLRWPAQQRPERQRPERLPWPVRWLPADFLRNPTPQ